MPYQNKIQCSEPGCRALVSRGTRCSKHPAGWKQYQQGRTRQERGYGAEWQRTRKRILERDHHLCQEHKRKGMLRPANIVDHIKAKAHGGTDADDNLEAICDPCHKAKTAREHGRGKGG